MVTAQSRTDLAVERFAAFSEGPAGGNPAGVAILDTLPGATLMQAIAAEVGYSETAFAAPEGKAWRVRYFAPAPEVDFCGHATFALRAALERRFGAGAFALQLNRAAITSGVASRLRCLKAFGDGHLWDRAQHPGEHPSPAVRRSRACRCIGRGRLSGLTGATGAHGRAVRPCLRLHRGGAPSVLEGGHRNRPGGR
jgi:hypothetical protein